jgi:hypothetical protein
MQLGQCSMLVIYTLKSMYYSYFHSVTKYGITFGGNSSYRGKNLNLQKQIITILAVAQPRTACRCLPNQSTDSACSCNSIHFINEMHYLYSGKISKQLPVYTQC